MSFKVQHQIRQNATDIRSYLDDLYAWEDQMNQPQATKKPTKSSTNPKQNKENFPIRGQALEEEEEQVIEESNTNDKGETTAINANLKKEHTTSTQYYDAWAKHAKQLEQDLEKEEIEAKKKADKPQQPVNPMQRTSGAEKNTKIVIKGGRSSYNEVESLKEKGNLYFKSSELDKAVGLYTEALEKGLAQQVNDELLVVLYSNRAMTYLKLREYLKAEEDCNSALKLNEKHVKSLVRRGNARKRLEKYKAALKDFEKATEVEPENKEIQEEIRLVKKKLETIKEEQKKKMLLPMSITQNPKVTVKVEDYDPDTVPEVLETQKPAVKASTGVENRDISTVTGASSATGEVTSEFLGLKDVEGKLVKHDEVEEAAVESAKQKVHFRLDLNVQEKNKGHLEPVDLGKKPKKSAMKRKNQPVPEEEKPKKKEAKITEDKISKAVEHGKELWQKKIEEDFKKSSSTTTNEKATEEASKVSRIENSSEFLNYWKHIRDNEETCEKFLLSQARPERFAEIFAAGVDFDLYMELIKFGLKIVERNSELPLGILEGLGKVKRFDINVKSMLGSEKKVIKEILDKATKSAERASPERLDDITKKYKL